MKLYDWLVNKKELPFPQVSVSTLIGGDRYSFNTRKSFAEIVEQGVYQNPAVQGCIAAYSMTLNEPPLNVLRNGKIVEQHPLSILLKRPNPSMSLSQLLSYVAAYIAIGGNCYLIKSRGKNGVPVELYPYHDGHITCIRGEKEWISHYEYSIDGRIVRVDKSDVVHLRSHLIDPLKPQVAMSPILAAARGVDTYNELARTIYSVLKNDAVVTGILSTAANAPTATNSQIQSLQEQMRNLADKNSSIRTLIAGGGMSYTRIGLGLNELEAVETFSQAEISICQSFRVHPLVAMTYAGLQHSTYSNMSEAYKQFTELFRVPTWNIWEEQIEAGFYPEYSDIEVQFDTSQVAALQPDKDIVHTNTIAAFQAGVITLNEAREALGYDVAKSEPTKGFKSETKEEFYFKGEVLTEEMAVDYWTKGNEQTDKHAKAIADSWSFVCAALEKEITGNVKKDSFNFELWKKKFVQGTHEARMRMIKDVLSQSLEDVGFGLDDLGDDYDAVLKMATLESSEKISQSVGTIRDEIRELLARNSEMTADELIASLKEKFATLKASRAAMIGRTTATATTGKAQKEVWGRLNKRFPKKKIVRVWYTMLDRKVRDSHMKLVHQPENDEGGWYINGTLAYYPSDSSLDAADAVGCRCMTIPTTKSK